MVITINYYSTKRIKFRTTHGDFLTACIVLTPRHLALCVM